MDDPRTRETLDALADLFLTGTTPPLRTPPGAPMRTPPRKVVDDNAPSTASRPSLEPKVVMTNDSLSPKPSPTPASSPASSVANELDGPGPISIGARHTSAGHYAQHADDDASYHEEPSSLRLHDEEESDADSAAQTAHVEAVILGNLPGFGGPWLTQYAFHLAQQRGPVGILHVAGDHADLELVTAQRQTVAAHDQPLPPGSSAEDLIARMQRMFDSRSQRVATWLVHLPSANDPTQLAKAATIGHWTILCGSDDMAIAGASRLLANMQQKAGEISDISPLVGIMIMGSDEAKAREAISKFNAAASSFLRQPVELVGSRKQMTPVHMRALGGATGEGVWSAVESFLSQLPVNEDEVAPPVRQTRETVSASPVMTEPVALKPVIERTSAVNHSSGSAILEPASEVEHLMQEVSAAANGRPAPPLAASRPTATTSTSSSSPRTPHAAPSRETQRAAIAPDAAPSSINEPDLVSLLTGSLSGSIALEARYPKQSDTQLILDQSGQLHLLRRQLGSDLKAALVDLIEARDWVTEHLQLIALTQRQCQFDMDAQPTLHLFTSDAKNAVAMVNKLGPFVKLHLLQEVRIGSARTWVGTDLN